MTDARAVLQRAAELAADYVETLGDRPVFPAARGDSAVGRDGLRYHSDWQGNGLT